MSGVNDCIRIEIPIIIGKFAMRHVPQLPVSFHATAPPIEQVDDELRMFMSGTDLLLKILISVFFCSSFIRRIDEIKAILIIYSKMLYET